MMSRILLALALTAAVADTTCPVPPLENRLKVRILAGEKDYPHHVAPAAR